jgi:two-component system, NarL family, nitrate/nitrite response regulator NarL
VFPAAHLLLVDDHPLYREGVLASLQRHAPRLRCRTADRAAAALQLLASDASFDLVLADHHLPGDLDGLALLSEVGRRHPTAARVLASGSDDPALPRHAQRCGLMGFLPKALEPQAWLAALGRILSGETWFPALAADDASGLTERQALILERVAGGTRGQAIALELGVTERTVKYHLGEIYARLGVTTRTEAVARAGARGWIRLPDGS